MRPISLDGLTRVSDLSGVQQVCAGAPAGGAYSFVIASSAGSGDGSNVTTPAVDTTTADLIVLTLTSYTGSARPTVGDSNFNTWTPITDYSAVATRETMFYCQNPVVGSGHTFSASGTTSFPSLCMASFKGSVSAPLDQTNGNSASGSVSSLQTGSVTPMNANELIVTGLGFNVPGSPTIDSSFIIPAGGTVAYSVGNDFAAGIAYLIQTSAVMEDPTWSFAGGSEAAAAIATFKAA